MTLEKIPSGENVADFGLGELAYPLDTLPLNVLVLRMEDPVRVIVSGELDSSTAPMLADKLTALDSEIHGDLVLDIGQLVFLGSAGLSLFVTEHKKLHEQGKTLIIFNPTPMARRLFQITGLVQILSIQPFEQPRYVR
jgi:anti-sigma B factor antagonist